MLVLGAAVAAAKSRQQAKEAQLKWQRDEIMSTVMADTFHDYGQMEVAAQWLDTHGFGADALTVRQNIRDKGGTVLVQGEDGALFRVGAPLIVGAGGRDAVQRTMRAFYAGKLTSHGQPVRARKQAIAIALNRARRSVGAEIGFMPDAATLLSALQLANRVVPARVGECSVGWWPLGSAKAWWTLSVTPAGGKPRYEPYKYLTADDSASWAMDATERNWGATVKRYRWDGSAWSRV
ncbi:MAG: hypothetical protein P8Y27_05000 [Chromatiaceae bacterium]